MKKLMKTRARADYEYNGNNDRYWDNSSTRRKRVMKKKEMKLAMTILKYVKQMSKVKMTVKCKGQHRVQKKIIEYKVMKMMTSKKTVVKVSKTKKEMKLRTMKKLVKTIPLED